MTTKLEFLENHPIFEYLGEIDLLALDLIAQEFEIDEGSVIAYQRDLADSMILVIDGRLYAREVDNEGVVRAANTRAYTENGFFGTDWLFESGEHPATVTATDAGRFIKIKGEDFRQYLVNRPSALDQLEPIFDEELEWAGGLPESAWELANQMPLEGPQPQRGHIRLLPDERVVYYTRRSPLYLLEKIFVPIVIFIIATSILLFNWPSDGTNERIIWFILSLLAILFTSLKIAYELYDWRNDFFVVTNMYITHREFSLRSLTTLMSKVPIFQVQTITVDKPTFMNNLLRLGGVRITTASNVGTISFFGIHNPNDVTEVVVNVREQVRTADLAKTQTIVRESVEKRFEMESGIRSVEAAYELPEIDPKPGRQHRSFSQFIRSPYSGRVVDGNTITYYRNIFVLVSYLRGPLLMLFLIVLVGIAVNLVFTGVGWIINTILIFALLLNLFLFWYQYEDWHNDMFQLTDRLVIDLNRSPFFTGVSRKQAPLGNIQNVRVNREGFWATIFDYGDVHIETAGAASDITFESIPNPGQALNDIFRRLDEHREAQRKREGALRHGEYSVLIDVYRQERERDRIPPRFPQD